MRKKKITNSFAFIFHHQHLYILKKRSQYWAIFTQKPPSKNVNKRQTYNSLQEAKSKIWDILLLIQRRKGFSWVKYRAAVGFPVVKGTSIYPVEEKFNNRVNYFNERVGNLRKKGRLM